MRDINLLPWSLIRERSSSFIRSQLKDYRYQRKENPICKAVIKLKDEQSNTYLNIIYIVISFILHYLFLF